jgi:molecular chaperone Hsp33
MMPFPEESVIERLVGNIASLKGVTEMFEAGMSVGEIMGAVLRGFNIDFEEELPVCYQCDCSRERVEAALISLGKTELLKLAEEGGAELGCHFCDGKYTFGKEELTGLAE